MQEGALGELLYANYIDLMSETIDELRNKFLKCMDFESMALKVNVGFPKVNFQSLLSGGITKDGMSKYKIDPCGI